MEGCIMRQAGVSDNLCNSANLGLPAQSANFTYTITAPSAAGDTGYTVTAIGINALASSDQIVVNRLTNAWPTVSATVSCVGAGKLLGAC